MSANDTQVGGSHYRKTGEQHWDRMWRMYREAWFVGNVTKYVERYREKNGLEDLRKARHYLDKLIELEEAEEDAALTGLIKGDPAVDVEKLIDHNEKKLAEGAATFKAGKHTTESDVTPNEYQRLALRTEADQQNILDRLVTLGPQAMRLDNAARGLAGDAGEVSSAVMKYIEYGRPLDVVNVVEEVGDCLWRLAQVCEATGLTLEECMRANLRKLAARYPDKYTDERAADRDRDAERSAIVQDGHGFGHVEQCVLQTPIKDLVCPVHGVGVNCPFTPCPGLVTTSPEGE